MVPEIRHDALESQLWSDQASQTASTTADGSEETVWDLDDDRGYDLGEGD